MLEGGAGGGVRAVGEPRPTLASRLKRSPRTRRPPGAAGDLRRGREGFRRAPEVSATATSASLARRTPFSGPGGSRPRTAAFHCPPEAVLAAAEGHWRPAEALQGRQLDPFDRIRWRGLRSARLDPFQSCPIIIRDSSRQLQ